MMSREIRWTLDIIKEGINTFFKDYGRYPTARDFDTAPYLPSARQVQRMYGGLPSLREVIGITELDYTKGDLRRKIGLKGHFDGLSAEESLEVVLMRHFGEPYVHTQKRYGVHHKNRYDFFVYCHNECFAVDIFSTGRTDYIATNIRHKITKYKEVGPFVVYFVVAGDYIDDDISAATKRLPVLKSLPHIRVRTEASFIKEVTGKQPLTTPVDFVSCLTPEIK